MAAQNYFGSATITSPTDLGDIDLAFHLQTDGSGDIDPNASYVILKKTSLFPVLHTLTVDGQSIEVGPLVISGFVNQGGMELELERFATSAPGKTKSPERYITLDNGVVTENGSVIIGVYTERIYGIHPQPIVLTGEFILVNPTPASDEDNAHTCMDLDVLAPSGELTLDELRSGGADSSTVEFEELICGMYFNLNPGAGPMVSDTTIEAAISDYTSGLTAQP